MEKTTQDYFKKLFSNKEEGKMGRLENANLSIEGTICPKGTHRDQVFFYARIEEKRIKEIKFMCAYCDPYMFVAADILCRMVEGKTKEEIERMNDLKDYIENPEKALYEHFQRAKELLLKNLS